ncbi:MAG: hypothetical protein Q7T83_07800 [Thermodesulfovibrionales bacterium]|nr:hypothetical protein [Thermodesulfovibrionales bacterium]
MKKTKQHAKQKGIEKILSLKGKVKWEGNLEDMRKGRGFSQQVHYNSASRCDNSSHCHKK